MTRYYIIEQDEFGYGAKILYKSVINKIKCIRRLMFSMTSLESEKSPLRTVQTFYQMRNRPNSKSSKKTFPVGTSQLQSLYNPTAKQLSTRKYLQALSKNKTLQRRPLNKAQLYSYVSFRRQNRNSPSDITNNHTQKQRSLSSIKLSSLGVSRAQSLCQILDNKEKYSFKNQWKQFQQKLSARQEQTNNRLRFTFYNNEQKSKFIMEKYHKDQSLDQRKTNLYQNVFNRTIAKDSLLKMIGELDKKRRKGQIV